MVNSIYLSSTFLVGLKSFTVPLTHAHEAAEHWHQPTTTMNNVGSVFCPRTLKRAGKAGTEPANFKSEVDRSLSATAKS